MNSEIHEWPPQKTRQARLADEMFLEAVLNCNCLRDEHLRILSDLADKFHTQVQASARLKIGKTEPQDD